MSPSPFDDIKRLALDALEKFTSDFEVPVMDVAMLGPRGSGKSSLIASMFVELGRAVDEAGLELQCDPMSEVMLQDSRDRLRSIVAEDGPAPDRFAGSRTMHRYHFTIAERRDSGKTVPAMHFDIVDYPGDWIERRETEAERAYYDQAIAGLAKARVIMAAVDAPYLMEDAAEADAGTSRLVSDPGPYHVARNRPDLIRRTLQEAFSSDGAVPSRSADGPLYVASHPARLVLLVPIRCEKYMASAFLRQALVEAVVKGYGDVDEYLASPALRAATTVAVTPVETTGCVVFDRWEPAQPYPQARFRFGTSSTFEPVFCEQPVCYMLRFAVEEYQRQRIKSVVESMKYVFDRDHKVHDAAAKFARRCRTDDGFLLLQRGTWT